MSLAVITFLYKQPPEWSRIGRDPYTAQHVNAAYRAFKANLTMPHRFICLTDQPQGIECETLPVWDAITVAGQQSCYRKVRAFDAEFQRALGEKILCIDLDVAVTGNLDHLITDDEFRIMEGSRNRAGQPCSHYNGSMWLCKAGARDFFWSEFTPDKAARMREQLIMPTGERVRGSDQAWFSCIAGPGEKTYGAEQGVFQYHTVARTGWQPDGAAMVFFAGQHKPWGAGVARHRPILTDAWSYYANGGALPVGVERNGRCLILGYAPTVWDDAARARGRFDCVIASPEAAAHRDALGWAWGDIDAVANSDDHALRLAAMLGYRDVTFCGRQKASA